MICPMPAGNYYSVLLGRILIFNSFVRVGRVVRTRISGLLASGSYIGTLELLVSVEITGNRDRIRGWPSGA
jgi:hypothetical protein